MKTVKEVIKFLESEAERLHDAGTYEDYVDYLNQLINEIKGE